VCRCVCIYMMFLLCKLQTHIIALERPLPRCKKACASFRLRLSCFWTQRHARLWMPLTSWRPRPRKRRVPEPGRLRPRVWGERRRAPAILKLGTEPSKEAKGWCRSALEPPTVLAVQVLKNFIKVIPRIPPHSW
jgi:hypothetical protein